jgi:hypothetical protein
MFKLKMILSYYIIYSKNKSKMVTKNRKYLIIDLNDAGFSRRNIQGVTNILFHNISYTTLEVKFFH